jgi:hypothetical protein
MNGIEKKWHENNAKHSPIIEITDYDDNAKYLIGWPGYRTANNKSGLGYLETQFELAHMQGVMLRQMITGKFITHNLFYLFMMFLFGILIGVIPLAMLLTEIFASGNFIVIFYSTPILLPYVVVGIALVVNVGISVLNPNAKSITGD